MVKAGTKQVIRAEKWVAEYRRWVGSGLTQRSCCGQVGLILCHRKEEFLVCVHPAKCGFIGGSFFACFDR